MDFLGNLTAHKGGLIRIKSELYWYGDRGWDGITDRVCLLMDAAPVSRARASSPRSSRSAACSGVAAEAEHPLEDGDTAYVTVLLLIDGTPHWIWVSEAYVELL